MRDDQLGDPTPCPAYTVGDLVDHIGGFPLAFIAAARKERLDAAAAARTPTGRTSTTASGSGSRRDLAELAEAWRDPAAYAGMTQAGPVDLPGEIAALVALDEVVVHGWDLAKCHRPGLRPGRGRRSSPLCSFAQSFEPPADAECRDRRRRPVRPAGGRPGRRPGPRPARRRHRPRPPLDPARLNQSCA